MKKLRTIEALRAFKVVVVSDRTQLERQLRGTMSLTGENVRPADGDRVYGSSQIEVVQRILREHGPDLVFCMIQKNQDTDRETETLKAEIPAYIRLEKDDEAVHDEAPRLQRLGRSFPNRKMRLQLTKNQSRSGSQASASAS